MHKATHTHREVSMAVSCSATPGFDSPERRTVPGEAPPAGARSGPGLTRILLNRAFSFGGKVTLGMAAQDSLGLSSCVGLGSLSRVSLIEFCPPCSARLCCPFRTPLHPSRGDRKAPSFPKWPIGAAASPPGQVAG